MRSTQNRIDAYNAKTTTTLYNEVMTAVVELAKGNFAASANAYESIEAQVMTVMGAEAVPRIEWGAYLAFANQMDRLHRLCAGTTFRMAGLVYINVWVQRSLTQSTLTAIAFEVFGWSAPAAF